MLPFTSTSLFASVWSYYTYKTFHCHETMRPFRLLEPLHHGRVRRWSVPTLPFTLSITPCEEKNEPKTWVLTKSPGFTLYRPCDWINSRRVWTINPFYSSTPVVSSKFQTRILWEIDRVPPDRHGRPPRLSSYRHIRTAVIPAVSRYPTATDWSSNQLAADFVDYLLKPCVGVRACLHWS